MKKLSTLIKLLFISGSVLIAFILIFLWVPKASPDNLIKIKGYVEDVNVSGGINDIVIKLKDQSTSFYINRGLESGLILDSLKTEILNKEIDIYVVRMRLNLITARHIAKVESKGKILYSHVVEI